MQCYDVNSLKQLLETRPVDEWIHSYTRVPFSQEQIAKIKKKLVKIGRPIPVRFEYLYEDPEISVIIKPKHQEDRPVLTIKTDNKNASETLYYKYLKSYAYKNHYDDLEDEDYDIHIVEQDDGEEYIIYTISVMFGSRGSLARAIELPSNFLRENQRGADAELIYFHLINKLTYILRNITPFREAGIFKIQLDY